MKKWEYMAFSATIPVIDRLTELGQQGWELACMHVDIKSGKVLMYFKREIPESVV
jgi:hypothetical protein